jgi:hypothetical protein
MEILKSKKVDATWTVLATIRTVATILLIVSIVGFLWSLGFFGFAGHLFSTQQNVAESEPHGVDAIAGLAVGLAGLLYFSVLLVVFIVSVVAVILTSTALRKKKVAAATQPNDEWLVTPPSTMTCAATPLDSATPDNISPSDK